MKKIIYIIIFSFLFSNFYNINAINLKELRQEKVRKLLNNNVNIKNNFKNRIKIRLEERLKNIGILNNKEKIKLINKLNLLIKTEKNQKNKLIYRLIKEILVENKI